MTGLEGFGTEDEMKKGMKIVAVLGGAVVLAGAFLVWYGTQHPGYYQKRQQKNLRPGEQYGVEYRQPGEVVIEDLGNGNKRITDKRQGYSVEVPADWQIQRPRASEDIFSFYANNQCIFSTGYLKTDLSAAQFVQESENRDNPYLSINKYEVTDITSLGFSGKRVIRDSTENGYSQAIYLDANKSLFAVSVGGPLNALSDCLKNFEQLVISTKL